MSLFRELSVRTRIVLHNITLEFETPVVSFGTSAPVPSFSGSDAGFRVRQARIPSSFAASKLEVEPLFKKPRLVSGLQTDRGGVDLKRAVPHDEPLLLWLKQNDEAAAVRPHLTMVLTARVPQRCDAGCRPKDTGITEGGLKWRYTAISGIT